MKKRTSIADKIWFVILAICSVAWVYTIFMILINSIKGDTAISTDSVFTLPTAENFASLANYLNAIDSKGFLQSLIYSLFITVSSVVAILFFCSM